MTPTLRYRVIVEVNAREGFDARVPAFASLCVNAPSPDEAIAAARSELMALLQTYRAQGRQPPPPDGEAVRIALVSVPWEAPLASAPHMQIDVTTGTIRVNGSEIAVRGVTLELLISLAIEARDVSIDALCARLYPGTPGDQAYNALKMCISRLRKQLGGRSVIETTHRGYRLAENAEIDIRFLPQIVRGLHAHALPKAVENRLESIFDQLTTGRPSIYERWEWFAPTERMLRAATRDIGLYVANRALRSGQYPHAAQLTRRLTTLDPLDEGAHELSIRVHLAAGDRASALVQYHTYVRALEKHGTISPSAALRALIETPGGPAASPG